MQAKQALIRGNRSIDEQLRMFDVRKQDLIEVGLKVANARKEVIAPIFPASAPGLLGWIHGVASLRELLIPKGWELRHNENLEQVYNPNTGITIEFVNAAVAGDPTQDPRSVNDRGPASRRAVDAAQPWLFDPEQYYENIEDDLKHWVLFVLVTEDWISIELACPKPLNEGQYAGFHQRILVVEPGELKDFINLEPDVSDRLSEINVEVTRKDS